MYVPGRPIIVEFSPVTDFREATCRQFEEDNCNRGGYCNFMHLKRIGRYKVNHFFHKLMEKFINFTFVFNLSNDFYPEQGAEA